MLIVEQGKVVDVCAEPGEYTYDMSTEPSIFSGDLGDGVKTLERSAFSGNTTLKHVVLGTGLTDVGEYAFNDVFKTVFYAQPGTAGYASGEALVADLNSRKGAQVTLQAYTPLSVELTATQSQETAQVTASATGGIEGTAVSYTHLTLPTN